MSPFLSYNTVSPTLWTPESAAKEIAEPAGVFLQIDPELIYDSLKNDFSSILAEHDPKMLTPSFTLLNSAPGINENYLVDSYARVLAPIKREVEVWAPLYCSLDWWRKKHWVGAYSPSQTKIKHKPIVGIATVDLAYAEGMRWDHQQEKVKEVSEASDTNPSHSKTAVEPIDIASLILKDYLDTVLERERMQGWTNVVAHTPKKVGDLGTWGPTLNIRASGNLQLGRHAGGKVDNSKTSMLVVPTR